MDAGFHMRPKSTQMKLKILIKKQIHMENHAKYTFSSNIAHKRYWSAVDEPYQVNIRAQYRGKNHEYYCKYVFNK